MSTIEERLGHRIARQRKALGLTQAQLPEKVGVQPETISRIESGSRTASLDLIAQIATALELELHDLFRSHEDDAKGQAVDRMVWFTSRLMLAEIELVMEVGSAVLAHARRGQHGLSAR